MGSEMCIRDRTKKTCILSVGEHVMSIVDTVFFKINVLSNRSYIIIYVQFRICFQKIYAVMN